MRSEHRYALYARNARANGESIRRQLDASRKVVEDAGGQVVAEFQDDGQSGLAMGAGLKAAVAAAEEGEFDHLVIHRLDRLARNPAVVVDTLKRLRAAGVTVTTATGRLAET